MMCVGLRAGEYWTDPDWRGHGRGGAEGGGLFAAASVERAVAVAERLEDEYSLGAFDEVHSRDDASHIRVAWLNNSEVTVTYMAPARLTR